MDHVQQCTPGPEIPAQGGVVGRLKSGGKISPFPEHLFGEEKCTSKRD